GATFGLSATCIITAPLRYARWNQELSSPAKCPLQGGEQAVALRCRDGFCISFVRFGCPIGQKNVKRFGKVGTENFTRPQTAAPFDLVRTLDLLVQLTWGGSGST